MQSRILNSERLKLILHHESGHEKLTRRKAYKGSNVINTLSPQIVSVFTQSQIKKKIFAMIVYNCLSVMFQIRKETIKRYIFNIIISLFPEILGP